MWRSRLCGPLHNQNNHVHRSTVQINTLPIVYDTASLLLCLPVCMHGLATTNLNNWFRTGFDKSNTGSAKKSNFTTLILE